MSSLSPLPDNNISQKLFYQMIPQCQKQYGQKDFTPAPCCTRSEVLGTFYKKTPQNLWNTATNYQGGPGFNRCTDDALFRQCMLSQYYNYLSKNNTLSS